MVKILLDFIRSERTGNWLAHLSATPAMLPYFFAMDRPNYSKWIPIYLIDMRKLPDTHPKVHEEFMNGNHSVSRSGQSFSQVWTDMALEQSVNLDSKKHGGIIGITLKPDALERWFLTSHERAAITTATKEMCGLQDSDQIGTHKESSQNRMSRDEADVQKLISVFTSELMTNPFFLTQDTDGEVLPLLNIATGAVMPKDLTYNLIHAVDLGKCHMENFVEERLNSHSKSFWDTVPQLKLKTFANLVQKTKTKTREEKIQVLNADRQLFGRLVIAAKSRDVDLRDVLTYELSAVPFALAHSDGTLRANTKSALLELLETDTEKFQRLPISEPPQMIAFVIDAMAMVKMIKVVGVTTFGALADKYWEAFTKALNQNDCNRIDI